MTRKTCSDFDTSLLLRVSVIPVYFNHFHFQETKSKTTQLTVTRDQACPRKEYRLTTEPEPRSSLTAHVGHASTQQDTSRQDPIPCPFVPKGCAKGSPQAPSSPGCSHPAILEHVPLIRHRCICEETEIGLEQRTLVAQLQGQLPSNRKLWASFEVWQLETDGSQSCSCLSNKHLKHPSTYHAVINSYKFYNKTPYKKSKK